MSSQYCLYIPIISTDYLEDDIKRIFSANIGKVVRVDFAPAKSRPGQGKNVHHIIRSAYVHISCFYRTRLAAKIQSTVFGSNEGFRFTITPREYWVLLKHRNPTPAGEQNIHQVLAVRLHTVESIVRSQQETIDSLQQSLLAQAAYGDRMLDTIVELLKSTSDGPFPDMANVYEQYNHIRFNKRHNKRWLLNHDDDGDAINQVKRNAAEIEDDYTFNEARRVDGDDGDDYSELSAHYVDSSSIYSLMDVDDHDDYQF